MPKRITVKQPYTRPSKVVTGRLFSSLWTSEQIWFQFHQPFWLAIAKKIRTRSSRNILCFFRSEAFKKQLTNWSLKLISEIDSRRPRTTTEIQPWCTRPEKAFFRPSNVWSRKGPNWRPETPTGTRPFTWPQEKAGLHLSNIYCKKEQICRLKIMPVTRPCILLRKKAIRQPFSIWLKREARW